MSQSTLNMLRSLNNSFHLKYMTLCKAKNCLPNHDVNKSKFKVEIIADRIKMNEWLIIIKSLEQDNSLECISINSRNAVQCVREQIDSEKKCRALVSKGDPLISTKFIFCPLIRSISNCIKQSTAITSLALEGLPLTVVYIQSISNAILQNSTLKMLSFARSNIMDNGCIIICSTIKHLSHIEKINFSQCDLTHVSASHIGDLIKFQTINRYLEGWMKSFRYSDVSPNSIPGLKCLNLNGNAQIGDKGLQHILLNLKDDEWIKAFEMQNCGITDAGGRAILNCLNVNKNLVVLDANFNPRLSPNVFEEIQKRLGAEPLNYETGKKSTIKLRERIDFLEQRLEIESNNRELAHELNIQLHNKLKKCESIQKEQEIVVPSGYKIVKEEFWNALYEQLEDLKQERLNRDNEQNRSAEDLRNRLSECFGSGDVMQMIRNNRRLGSIIKENETVDDNNTESRNPNPLPIPTSANDEEILSPVVKNKMRCVHTLCKEQEPPLKKPNDDGETNVDKKCENE